MAMEPIKIVFHGANAANFRQGFDALVDARCQIVALSDALDAPGERAHYECADVIVGVALDGAMPQPRQVKLFHAPAAGIDAIDTALLPVDAQLCNCFGHEAAIAEYVMAALLQRHVPLGAADADLRRQHWTYQSGRASGLRSELGEQTLGLLGFGHIAQAILARAHAFGMRAVVANRSPLDDARVSQVFGLDALPAFMAAADVIVVALPLTAQTTGLVNAQALAAMRPDAVIVNVGRGAVIDEQALFDALNQRRIGGAIIDTWYRYPTPQQPDCAPSQLDFSALPNVVMTPHMSGWTTGTVQRRQHTIAENIRRWLAGQPLVNVVWPRSGSAS